MSDKELVKRLLYLHRVTRDYDQEYMTSADYADMPVTTKKAADRIEALEAKLAAAVDWFETIRDRAKGDYMAYTYYLDALAALATIKRREP